MKKNILLLILLLSHICFSDTLVLAENVDMVVVERSATVYPYYHYIPENDRIKLILNEKKVKLFISHINKCKLILNSEIHQDISTTPFCYEIKIYNRNILIATFSTNGIYFYYDEHKLSYDCETNVLKYWGDSPYLLEENYCL